MLNDDREERRLYLSAFYTRPGLLGAYSRNLSERLMEYKAAFLAGALDFEAALARVVRLSVPGDQAAGLTSPALPSLLGESRPPPALRDQAASLPS